VERDCLRDVDGGRRLHESRTAARARQDANARAIRAVVTSARRLACDRRCTPWQEQLSVEGDVSNEVSIYPTTAQHRRLSPIANKMPAGKQHVLS